MTPTSALHRAARHYAHDLNIPVFPLRPGHKIPLHPYPHPKNDQTPRCRGRETGCLLDGHGVLDATTDLDLIDFWWGDHPDANIGLACGWHAGAGIDVLDFDTKPGQHGQQAHALLSGRFGDADLLLGVWRAVHTPSGGLHLYFLADPTVTVRNSGNKRWGVDVRGRGGYVAAPPSRTAAGGYCPSPVEDVWHDGERLWGRRYRPFPSATVGTWWRHDGEYPLPGRLLIDEVQGRLQAWLPGDPEPGRVPPPRARPGSRMASLTDSDDYEGLVTWLATQGEGSHNRNMALHWAACRAAERGYPEVAFDELINTATRVCRLPVAEAVRTVASARRGT